MNEIVVVLIWLLVIELIGLLSLPITSYLCKSLPDKGYSISKPMGVLLLTYFTWLPVSLHLIRFGQVSIIAAHMILLLFSILVVRKKKQDMDFSDMRIYIAKTELVFIIAFSAMAFILSYKPDILAMGSEDFMDYAFLQSLLRSTALPPPDPWLAGEVLSYYYFGQLEAAILTIFSGIPSNITYNLAVSTFFGFTVSAAYGLGYNLTGRSLYGIATAVFISVAGMLSGFLQLLIYLAPSTGGFINYTPLSSPNLLQWLYDFDFWTAITSVIPGTFIFYPYYAFVHGNLHAQITGFSSQVMLLVLYLALLKDRKTGLLSPLFLVVALSLGFFAGLDIWEYPFYFMMLFLVLFIRAYKEHPDAFRSLRDAIVSGGIAAFAGILFYVPYYTSRDSGGFRGVLPVTVQRTLILDFLQVFGLFVFLIASFLIVYYAANRERVTFIYYSTGILSIIPALMVATIWDFQMLPLLAAVILLAACAALKQRRKDEECFSLLLVAAGGLVALFPELLYVVDAMPQQRFNTQMKLYLQVWFFWGIASAYAIYYVNRHVKDMKNRSSKALVPALPGYTRTRTVHAIWAAAVVFLISASFIHPIASTVSWTVGAGASIFGNTEKNTLDGTRYMQNMHRGEYMAIQWINRNIQGSPAILEAPGEAYSYSSPIATMTGIPTVLGWKSHEFMWNNNWDKISERENDINTIYSTADANESLRLLEKYNVQYIYIGENELAKYKTGLDKFEDERYFERVYREYAEIYLVK